MATDSKAREHFVYVYRDAQENPVYFGQGKGISRSVSHAGGSHNGRFDEWLKAHVGQFRVEVIGPLGSRELADALETALISACMPAKALQRAFFNISKGQSQYRFRPFGVPAEYAERTLNPLGTADLRALCVQVGGTLMFVRINQTNFETDGRLGYDPASPPSDEETLNRVDRWWQVASRVPQWAASPASSPALLIGVTGLPGAQYVIASIEVDRDGWSAAERWRDGLLRIPVQGLDLDAVGLRGRPIRQDVGLSFGSFRQRQFQIRGIDDF